MDLDFFGDPGESEGCRAISTEVGYFRGLGHFSWLHVKVRVLSWIFDASGVSSWIWTIFVDPRRSAGFVVVFRPRWGFFVDLDYCRGSTRK